MRELTARDVPSPAPAPPGEGSPQESPDLALLEEISRRVLWLSAAVVDAANNGRENTSGIKVGGHQASSASMVDIMVALWFHTLRAEDRVSVKPHASPVLHAINYLLGDLDASYLPRLRDLGGLQSYPSRTKDPDRVDFSTGSVGIGATAALWAAIAHRYVRSHFPDVPPGGRFVSLVGDAELDEGAIWEAVADVSVASLGELLWVVDLNRQSLDRVVPDIQIQRLTGLFAAAGWQVVTLKWGRRIAPLFERPGGQVLRRRLEEMTNEEYQRVLRAPGREPLERILGDATACGPDEVEQMRRLLEPLETAELRAVLRDLGGHDLGLLIDAFESADTHRPTVVFAYTIKGKGLPTEGHPNNHSSLLTPTQMADLAEWSQTSPEDPWRGFAADEPAGRLCADRARVLERPPVTPTPAEASAPVPAALGHGHRKAVSTQAALGRVLADLPRDAPELARRIVTCSPDVASSTNLGGWINKSGVWSVKERHDWFADDPQRILRWAETPTGRHIELGIAEVNLVGLAAELGATWSRWGERLVPIATIYDPFVSRALEPWSYGMYAGGQSILVGTPSGVTLAPEGGAHQSITTPSIGLEQPGCVAWEPAFGQDLEWCFLEAVRHVGVPGGTSAYFRLSTRPIDPALARVPEEPAAHEHRRRLAVRGGYRIPVHDADADAVTLVGVGALMPEVIRAAESLGRAGVPAGVVCLTSPDLVFRAVQGEAGGADLLATLFPPGAGAPLVTILDGHPHTLAFLAAVRGDRIRCLGVSQFGQSSSVEDAYRLHGIDVDSIVHAALSLIGR